VKAFLMAAGTGTRLRPITDTIPKCLVPIQGVPLLDIWLEALAKAGIDEVLLNLHYLPGPVQEHLRARPVPVRVVTSYEPDLLGSAGTLRANRDWVGDDERFLVCYADNLTDFAVGKLICFHRERGATASLALFRAPDPSACGIVELDDTGRVTGFEEKPRQPVSDLANAGIYVFESAVLGEIQGPAPEDIGFDLLPRLIGRTWGLPIDGYFRDIGTVEAYQRAQLEWNSGGAR
jgi:mannose-1-phosphate guanylyltransferase